MKMRNYFKMNSTVFLFLLIIIFLVYFKSVKQESMKNSRIILSEKMSLQNFKSKTNALKKEVNDIASKNKYEEYSSEADENLKKVPLKQSRTIIYNRIDKAGSTTLIGKKRKIMLIIVINSF